MTELSEDGNEALTSVTRVRVQVRADAFVYEGLVTLEPDSDRLQTVLNDPRPFLNMTDVTVFDATTGGTYSTAYLALNKGAITHVVLVTEGLSEGVGSEPALQAPSGATLPPQPPPSQPIVRRPAPPAARTVPKIPVPRRDDPSTQPFPGLGSELSDLILDQDGDDIDPDDLLGASGDYNTRSLGD